MKRSYWASIFYDGSASFTKTVQEYEERGLAGLEVPQVYEAPFVPLAAAAAVTKRVQLATGIAIGLTRSPFETAMTALDLDHLSQGRFILGLGTGPEHFTKGYYGMPYDKPVSRLREVVQILRRVEEGAHWSDERLARQVLSLGVLWLRTDRATASRTHPRMDCCSTGAHVRTGGRSWRWAHWASRVVHPMGARTSPAIAGCWGSASGARSVLDPFPAVDHGVDWTRSTQVAVSEAKPSVAFYGGITLYHSFFAAHGFAGEARKLQEASNSMSCAEAAHLVPDEMARTFVACGTPEQVREHIEPLWQRANSMMIVPPSWGLTPERYAAKAAAIADTFWKARE